ncbi:MAG: DUF2730 family protein [Pseudomonadota bacterium]|uniref:DUF2730 family protein n=1 Tax=Providencia manganoxydans TaxID=2923283 RepID=UPI0024A15AD8
MGFNELMFDLPTTQNILMVVIGVYAWMVKRQSASQKELTEMQIRLAEMEVKISQMPTQAQVSRLIDTISRNDAILQSLVERLGGMSRQLDNLNQYLLHQKKE